MTEEEQRRVSGFLKRTSKALDILTAGVTGNNPTMRPQSAISAIYGAVLGYGRLLPTALKRALCMDLTQLADAEDKEFNGTEH